MRGPAASRGWSTARCSCARSACSAPTEAVMSLGAFTVVLRRRRLDLGRARPAPALLAVASGTAFAAIAVGQMANAFACRSSTAPVWRLAPLDNPLLVCGRRGRAGAAGRLPRRAPAGRAARRRVADGDRVGLRRLRRRPAGRRRGTQAPASPFGPDHLTPHPARWAGRRDPGPSALCRSGTAPQRGGTPERRPACSLPDRRPQRQTP